MINNNFNNLDLPIDGNSSYTPSDDGSASFWEGLGNSFTGDLDFKRQQILNAQQAYFNATEAEKNRQWQEKMSNTAYSRAVADIKNAGFNPYYALSPSGATAGSGSFASMSSGSVNSTNGLGTLAKGVGAITALAFAIAKFLA